MKKTYIEPRMEITESQVTSVLCTSASLPIGDGNGAPAEIKENSEWDMWEDE